MIQYQSNRAFMNSSLSDIDIVGTADIAKGVPQPASQQPVPDDALRFPLPAITRENAPKIPFFEAAFDRCSRRNYTGQPIVLVSGG